MKDTSVHLKKLLEKKQKLEARIQALEARAHAAERKKDMRRKILVGSYYLNEALKNQTMDKLKALMDGYLTRDSDRKLFDLIELPKSSTTQ